MQKGIAFLYILLIFIAVFLHFLALMDLFPLLISSPLLFFLIFIFFYRLNARHRFRGFR
ncbi:hypothetical protein ACT3HK_04205 [Thermolongibacillus altinsuensis]